MNSKEILEFCIEKGLLIDNEVLGLFKDTEDIETVKIIIGKIKEYTQKRIITKEIFYENRGKVNEFFQSLPRENKELEKLRIKLGLSIEISRQKTRINTLDTEKGGAGMKIVSMFPTIRKKLEVRDFITHFRGRFNEMKNTLQEHTELNNLISINKISGNRQGISILGMVYDKNCIKFHKR